MRSVSGELDELRRTALHRRLTPLETPQGAVVRVADDAELLNFSSNDYLGLADSPVVREALHEGIEKHGGGSGASRLVCGTLPPHAELENALAALKRTEAALTFSSGYTAALGAVTALTRPKDVVILDKLCHASLIDGARLSGATIRVFPHNHMEKLERLLRWARAECGPDGRVLVVTESVFSMDGDWADLWEIVRLKETYGALLLLDEAHAFGVFGARGGGLAEKLGLGARVDLQMGTLSKAAGLSGGYLCGSRELIDLILNRARSFIYTTAPPPALAAAATEVVTKIFPTAYGSGLRNRLWTNLKRFAENMKDRLPEPESAIIPVIIGDERLTLDVSARLREAGFLIPAIRYPTVARGTARLRLTLTAAHTAEQIDRLCDALREHLPPAA